MPRCMRPVGCHASWDFYCGQNVKEGICAGGNMLVWVKQRGQLNAFYSKSLIIYQSKQLFKSFKVQLLGFTLNWYLFYYSSRLLFAEYVIRKTSQRCFEESKAGRLFHYSLVFRECYIVLNFIYNLCKSPVVLFKLFMGKKNSKLQFWSTK